MNTAVQWESSPKGTSEAAAAEVAGRLEVSVPGPDGPLPAPAETPPGPPRFGQHRELEVCFSASRGGRTWLWLLYALRRVYG